MSYGDRENSILEYLREHKTATISELCNRLFVSEPTMRRDLARLNDTGKIIRTYGGASYKSELCENLPYSLREKEHSEEKILIAKKCMELISDGDSIMLDASSTADALLKFLGTKSSIVLITNNAKAPLTLCNTGVKTFVSGGEIAQDTYAYVGNYAEDFFRFFNADICFFSIRTLTVGGLLTDNAISENAVRKIMLSRSKRKVLLMDSQKIGEPCINTLCSLDDVDNIVCEKDISKIIPKTKEKLIIV